MHLITTLFNETHRERADEYIHCLDQNVRLGLFEQIHVFYDTSADEQQLGPVWEAIDRTRKLIVHRIGGRPTYGSIFAYCNEHLLGHVVVLSNGDIEFDKSIAQVRSLDWGGLFLSLARDDFRGTLGEGASDVWIFRTPIRVFGGDLPMGTAYCDQVISFLALQNGYSVENPCFSVRCLHRHATKVRSRPGGYDDHSAGSSSSGAFQGLPFREFQRSVVRNYGLVLGCYSKNGGGLIWPSKIDGTGRIRRVLRPHLRLDALRRSLQLRTRLRRLWANIVQWETFGSIAGAHRKRQCSVEMFDPACDDSPVSALTEENAGHATPASSIIENPIFIVGVSRSGTTLFWHILNNHPRISIYSETHFFSRVWDKHQGPLLTPEQIREALDRVVNLELHDLAAEEIEVRFRDTDQSLQSLFDAILQLSMEKTNKSRYGEKTPSNFRYLDVMLTWYPQAKVIFMVRDPRDVHGSYKNHWLDRKEGSMNRRVAGRALYWNYGLQALNKAVQRYPGQIMKVSFHTLIQDPAATVRSVCDFIGEVYHENMSAVRNTNSSFEETKKDGIDKVVLNRREYLSKGEIVVIEFLCGHAMMTQGYKPSIVPAILIRGLAAIGFYTALPVGHMVFRRVRSYWQRTIGVLSNKKGMAGGVLGRHN